MNKYRNAILIFNPRSYLEFEGVGVNNAIRETILSGETNEFALLNNGITMISDETNINERIGQRNKAQLFVKNPQIINGGQTAFTLSRILQNDPENAEQIFAGKEVLLKVITLTAEDKPGDSKILIDRISNATNRQTAVTNADRHSNEDGFTGLQKIVFERYGILFERKKGEFGDGVRDGYIGRSQVLDRNAFAKIYLAANGYISEGITRKAFSKLVNPHAIAADVVKLDRFHFGYEIYEVLGRPPLSRQNRATVGKLFTLTQLFFETGDNALHRAIGNLEVFTHEWDRFIAVRSTLDKKSRRERVASGEHFERTLGFKEEIENYFKLGRASSDDDELSG
jgi:hypothetical protein